jgi:hypothetical protein
MNFFGIILGDRQEKYIAERILITDVKIEMHIPLCPRFIYNIERCLCGTPELLKASGHDNFAYFAIV